MARPRRNGVDYFPFDIDFLSDDKIRMLKARYGAEGITIYIYLLTRIYGDKGYYLEWHGEDSDYLTAEALNMKVERVKVIVNYMLEKSLFDNALFASAGVLSSAGVQRRYQQAIKARASKNPVAVRGDLWLLGVGETEPFISVCGREGEGFSGNNPDNSLNNPDYSSDNPSFSENYDTKQSKVKHSKVKHSKAKEGEEKKKAEEQADEVLCSSAACCAAHMEFERIKSPSQSELERITELAEQFGEQTVISAIRDAYHKGGRSLAYVERILGDIAAKQSERYQPTYDKGEIEALLQAEWFEDEW